MKHQKGEEIKYREREKREGIKRGKDKGEFQEREGGTVRENKDNRKMNKKQCCHKCKEKKSPTH